MAFSNRDIVLLDSDSEPETENPQKRLRLSAQAAVAPGPTNIPSMTKPFMEESDGESSENTQNSSRGESTTDSITEVANGNSNPNMGTFLEGVENEGGLSAGIIGTDTTNLLARELEVSSSEEEPDVSLDLVEISDSDFSRSNAEGNSNPEAEERKHNVYQTRKFVKEHGRMAFFERYATDNITCETYLDLLSRLGFKVKTLPPERNAIIFSKLMFLLYEALDDVESLRPRLEDFYTVPHVANALKKAKKIVVITGAGISTSLGIPDFRSSEGFYSKMASFDVSDPQEVFSLPYFRDDPSLFYSIAHMIIPPENVKAPLHMFLKLLQDKGKLLRNYTQNIDNIEANAGIRPDKMVQCHGSLAGATCITCKYHINGKKIYPEMKRSEIAYCPKCSRKRKQLMRNENVHVSASFGVMKPDITFFGENLPESFHSQHKKDLKECDLLLSIGTSLRVSPVSGMVNLVPPEVPQILINRDPIPTCNFDVSFLGYCDDVVSYLCDQLGQEWNIDHPDYKKIVGPDHNNVQIYGTEERGVFHVRNRIRDIEEASKPKKAAPEPDLVVLEPSIY